MNPGAWVFPITIGCFAIFIGVYLAGHPATPAGAERSIRFQPGDEVQLEYTEFFDRDRRYVSFTTDEALYASGKYIHSPYGTGHKPDPVNVAIDPTALPDDGNILSTIIGHRINETFTTPVFEKPYGDWADTRTLPRLAFAINLTVLVTNNPLTNQHDLNYTDWTLRGQALLGRPLTVGDEYQCDIRPAGPWNCRVEAINPAAQTLTFRRTVAEGERIDAELLYSLFTPNATTLWMVIHLMPDNSFQVLWDMQPPETFVLGTGPPSWPRGSYLVQSVTGDSVVVKYTPGTNNPPHLIGQDVWYEFKVVAVTRETATDAAAQP